MANKIGLTTTVVSDLAWQQLVQIDAPANSPVASTVAGVAPVQSWDETDQVLPDIGDVDAKLLGAAGLSNTILISTTTKDVLETITVSIGANGNWYVGTTDTGVPAKGTNEQAIARPTGVYGSAVVYQQSGELHIGAGLAFCTKEGPSYYTMTTTAEIVVHIASDTTFVTIDRHGVTRVYNSGISLWLIPESQALVAMVVDVVNGVNVLAVPTVHNAMLMATAVIPYSQEAINAAGTATTQALIAGQKATEAADSAAAAEAAKAVTQADASITTTNVQLTENFKNAAAASATAAATSEQSAHNYADYADADRVATSADRAQVAADKAVVETKTTEAAASASAAESFSQAAGNSTSLAAEWAQKAEDSAITGNPGKYSAFHWAQKAQQWAGAVASALVWKGSWNASTGAPPTPAVGTGAPFYRITVAGTINTVSYLPGDYIHWDTVGLQWFKVDGTDSVTSVNGLYGDVTLTAANVGAAPSTHVGATGTAHGRATTSVDGFMSSTDKTKLDTVASGANNYSHPTGDGNLHVPATGTANNNKFLMAGPTAGSLAWQALTAANISGVLPLTGGNMGGPIGANIQKSAITVNGQGSISYQDNAQTMFHTMAYGNTLAIAKNVAGDVNIWSIDPNGATTQSGSLNLTDANSRLIRQAANQMRMMGSSLAFMDGGTGAYISSNMYYNGSAWAKTTLAAIGGLLSLDNGNLTYSVAPAGTVSAPAMFSVSNIGRIASAHTAVRSWSTYGSAAYVADEATVASGNLRGAMSFPLKITGQFALDCYIATYSGSNAADQTAIVLGATDGGSYNRNWLFYTNGAMLYWNSPGTLGTIASSSPMTAPSFTPTSDGRLKPVNTREDIVDATSFIKQLKAKLFFKKYAIDSEQGQMEYGLIADDVEPLKPHLVRIIGEDKLKCLDWTGISAHLVAAFNELEQRVATLEGANG
ncbi:hypothetical protein P5_0016 [Aeromonas phage P5]|nr:hypothetical protein P5_0016 [Aeromonas phage P5]